MRGRIDPRLDQIELGLGRDQRHHDLEADRLAGALPGFDRGLEDRPRLHLGDLGIGNREAAAAETEHRIEFGQFAGAVGEPPRIGVHRARDFLDLGLGVRQELMQRRIEQPDGHRQALHDFEQFDEIGALHRQQFRQRGAARLLVLGEDHLAHGADAGFLEEHVLGAAQADAFSAELDRGACVLGVSPLTRTPACAPDRPSPSACRTRRTVPARSSASGRPAPGRANRRW